MIKISLSYRFSFLQKVLAICLWVFIALSSTNAIAQFAVVEDFRGAGNADIIIGGAAVLTSGNVDPVNSGWLRLTPASGGQKGHAYINKSFPATLGVVMDFEYKMWRPSDDGYDGADGLSVFLFDGNTSSNDFTLGGDGGSLGYAKKDAISGLKGGYVGIGIDAYGNFASATDGNKFGGPGRRPNSIVMRGPTTTNNSANVTAGGIQPTNRFLKGTTIRTTNGTTFSYGDTSASTGLETENAIDYNVTTSTTRPNDATFYRRVQIEIQRLDVSGQYYKISVRWKTNPTDLDFTPVLEYITQDVPPALLKIGFAAATGGGYNYHEIRNLFVTTPGNLRVVKRANKDLLQLNTANNTITYSIEVTNDTDFEAPNIAFLDKFTDAYGDNLIEGTDYNVESITPTGFISTALPTAAAVTSNVITGTLVLGARKTGRITIVAKLLRNPQGNVLTNMANVVYPLDEDENNNTSIVRTPVIAEGVDLVLSKTVTQQCIDESSTALPIFTVHVSNIGAGSAIYNRLGPTNGQRMAIRNIVPAGYTYDDTGTPAGYFTGTPGGFTGTSSNADNGNVTARWSRTITNNPDGSKTYLYIARGTASTQQTLGAGVTYPDPIMYTVKPPTGTLTYNDVSTAVYFTDSNFATPNEPPANLINNDASVTMNLKPGKPVVSSATIYYCIGEDAVALTADKTATTNTLRWYVTPDGFSSEFAIVPYTDKGGTFKYYVSQVNGSCEGPKAEITVVVGPADPGTITAPSITCPGTNTTITGTPVSGATYRWQSSPDGVNWTTITGTSQDLIVSFNVTTYFRRLTKTTVVRTCEAPTNVVQVFIPDPGIVGNSQAKCDGYNPDAFTSVSDGTSGTINGVTYSYRWERSDDGLTDWTNANNNSNNSTSVTYDYNRTLNSTRYFRRTIRYTVGGSTCIVPSNIVVAYVGPDSGSGPSQGTISGANTICVNTAPPTITSTDGGGTGYFRWDYSYTGTGSWVNIPDASPTSGTYSPGILTQNTWFRRTKINGCGTPTGKIVAITVINPQPGSISIAAPTTICYGATPNPITSVAGTGGTTYKWEYALGTSDGVWEDLGVSTATFTPPALASSIRYRRFLIGSTSCVSDASNVITIIVKSPTDPKTIGPAQTVCNGVAPAILTGDPAVGDGAITYLWQESTTNLAGSWSSASSTHSGNNSNNNITYIPRSITMYYRRAAYADGSCVAYTPSVLITESAVPQPGNIIIANQNICNGGTPDLITSGPTNGAGTGTGTISYAWKSSTDNINWSTPDIVGANVDTYQPGALTATTYYRRYTIAKNGTATCRSLETNTITIIVSAVPQPGNIVIANQNICNGATPDLITSGPTNGVGTGTGTISYAWKSSTDNVNWSTPDIVGANVDTYQPGALTATTYYRRYTIAKNGSATCRSTETNTITITVSAVPTPGNIVIANQNICNGATPNLITSGPTNGVGTGTGTISYAWKSSTDNVNWSTPDIVGANVDTYQPGALTATTYYRRYTIAKNGTATCRSLETNTITITVSVVPQPGNIVIANQNVCNGGTPNLITSGPTNGAGTGTGTISYAWKSSTDNINWSTPDIVGANVDTYQPGALTTTTYYRRYTIAKNGTATCRSLETNTITINVHASLTQGSIGADQKICNGTAPLLLTSVSAGTLGVGGTGTMAYKWQSSIDNGLNWINISGAIADTYQAPLLTETTQYRRITTSTTGCESVATVPVTITVLPMVDPGIITGNQVICMDTLPTLLGSSAPGRSTGYTITYRWESSANGSTGWTTIDGATTETYSPTILHTTTYYKRVTIVTSTGGVGTVSCEASTVVISVTTKNCKVITNPMIYQKVN